MNKQPDEAKRPQKFKLLFSIIFFALGVVLMGGALAFYAWKSHRAYEANLPRFALPALALGLRTFHAQWGRFPQDLRELDERLWKGARAAQISPSGDTLVAASGHYTYRYHRVNATTCVIWAAPTGPRYEEAATHFWYLTPTQVERWMGPALTRENVNAIATIPSEPQLRWLMMTPQPPAAPQSGHGRKGALSFLPFL